MGILKIAILLITAFLLAAPTCQKEVGKVQAAKVCDVENPLADLIWLKAYKNDREASMMACKAEIYQYTFKDKIVFWIDGCKGMPDNMIQVFDCEGKVVCEFGGYAGQNTCPDFEKEAINKQLIWET